MEAYNDSKCTSKIGRGGSIDFFSRLCWKEEDFDALAVSLRSLPHCLAPMHAVTGRDEKQLHKDQ
jgi:hypothetical protein